MNAPIAVELLIQRLGDVEAVESLAFALRERLRIEAPAFEDWQTR